MVERRRNYEQNQIRVFYLGFKVLESTVQLLPFPVLIVRYRYSAVPQVLG